MLSLVADLIARLWDLLEFLDTHPDTAEAADQRARTVELIERAEETA
jgi:hypothetical protein